MLKYIFYIWCLSNEKRAKMFLKIYNKEDAKLFIEKNKKIFQKPLDKS